MVSAAVVDDVIMPGDVISMTRTLILADCDENKNVFRDSYTVSFEKKKYGQIVVEGAVYSDEETPAPVLLTKRQVRALVEWLQDEE